MNIVISIASGSDDPTRASLGMVAAKVAAEMGHNVTVWLQGEAVTIANKGVYPSIQGVNMPAMKDVMQFLLDKNVPLWVCEACGKGRNVNPDNWVASACYKTMKDYLEAALSMDRSLSF